MSDTDDGRTRDGAYDDWLDALGLDDAPPIWAGREARDGPTAYCCEEFACSPPKSSLSAALDWRSDDR